MSAYAEAQARLTDAKRRRDTRGQHAAAAESKRLLTQALTVRFGRKRPWWRKLWGRR